MDSRELRLGTSTVAHLLFTGTISDPEYIKDSKFNKLHSIVLGPITLTTQTILAFNDIILNSYASLQSIKFEINLKSVLRLHDKECQHQILRLLDEVIPCCLNLKYLKAQFQGINEGLYAQHTDFINRLFKCWLELHRVETLPTLKGFTLKLSYHFTRFLTLCPDTKELYHFLSHHPTLNSIHLSLSDFNRTDSPIASFIAAAPNKTPSAISERARIRQIVREIFKSLHHRKCPLDSFECTTFSLDEPLQHDINRIIQSAPNLTRFDIHCPNTSPSELTKPFNVMLSHFNRFNEGHLVHFRYSEHLLCDQEVLRNLTQFVSQQTELETFDISNIYIVTKVHSTELMLAPNEPISTNKSTTKSIDSIHSSNSIHSIRCALQCLLESIMKCPELRILQLPRCDVLHLEQYLDICYDAVIESHHVWQHEESKLLIPICVDQDWILNVCENFNESHIDTFFHPIHQFVEKLVVFQRDIYPNRLREQTNCCHRVLKRCYSVDSEVMGLIASFGIRQS